MVSGNQSTAPITITVVHREYRGQISLRQLARDLKADRNNVRRAKNWLIENRHPAFENYPLGGSLSPEQAKAIIAYRDHTAAGIRGDALTEKMFPDTATPTDKKNALRDLFDEHNVSPEQAAQLTYSILEIFKSMKFNRLAKELDLSVNELAEKASTVLSDANGGTDVDEAQAQAIRALFAGDGKETRSPQPASGGGNNANAVFETEAPNDADIGIAALDGMLKEYSHRLQGLAVAHQWIKAYEESGAYPADPDAAKRLEAVCLLRSLNIPYQAPHPTLKTSGGNRRELSLPPSVRAILGNVFPNELAGIERETFDQPVASRPQLSGS